MTVAAMREALINRYSHTIRGRSVDRMPDGQVIAIYHSLMERKDPAVTCGPGIPKKSRLHRPERYEQTRMDFLND